MSDQSAIKVQNVSKHFLLPHQKTGTFKNRIINPKHWFTRKHTQENQKALNNINFEIYEGEFFGIVGRNGSGKSTLLKTIAEVYSPSQGNITVNGTLVPFIELGVGFNPELSGRDNVFLNGALLGFTRAQMEEMYDDIVEFAELEKFMDQKLKNYSSGMQVRLAFSIAIRADGDILLLDEVLAVGDSAFQNKCYEYFDTLKRNRKTVILVSHNMEQVAKYCTRAMLLDKGEVKLIGTVDEVTNAYFEKNKTAEKHPLEAKPSVKVQIGKVVLKKDTNKSTLFDTGDSMTIDVDLKYINSVDDLNVGIGIHNTNFGYVMGYNTLIDSVSVNNKKKVSLTLQDVPFLKGDYFVNVILFGKKEKDVYDFKQRVATFHVSPTKEPMDLYKGTTYIEHKWEKK